MADVLKSLIVFAVVLALVGTAFAGIYYFTVDVPAQQPVLAPTNAGQHEAFYTCLNKCSDDCNSCIQGCYQFPENSNERSECKNKCPCDVNKDCKQCNILY